ncbi:hypothetical protein [Ornithinimicrobium sp. INDO-MA30-4]|uniref:hypothetical protein n=1 Tax=Ornithinimicrobium sp. INDO-MA30-4 TaxID=2908651 RepID=UPI001F3A67D6|nr:hypothetical protein [Ornithinimicrobium sp. INDO-MA30-4]UJH70058.1 hypothetical protein L0A91_12755 [Ornithinimicrobium sp. INDO-MA30-4]
MKLQRLSQPALDTLSQLMNLWLQQCRFMDHGTPDIDFGDPGNVQACLRRPLEIAFLSAKRTRSIALSRN